jgi:hypothetical protein
LDPNPAHGNKQPGVALNPAAPSYAPPTRPEYLPAAAMATIVSRSSVTSRFFACGELWPIRPKPGIRGLPDAYVFAAIPGSNPRARQLLLFLLVNLTLVALASLATSAFHAFSPSYNVWALPVTALIGATALTHRNRNIRLASTVCVGVIVAADCYAAQRLSTAGEVYGHTRSTVVKTAVDSVGPSNAIVLYVNDAPSIYFALMYEYRGSLRQYIATESTVNLIGAPASSPSLRLCELNAGTLLVVTDQQLSAETLQFQLTHPHAHTQALHALGEFLDTQHAKLAPKWTLASRNEYLAQSALALAVFKSREADVSPSSTNCAAQ